MQPIHAQIIDYYARAGGLNGERETAAIVTLATLFGKRGGEVCSVADNIVTAEKFVAGAGHNFSIDVALGGMAFLPRMDEKSENADRNTGLSITAMVLRGRVKKVAKLMKTVGIVGGISIDHIVIAHKEARFEQPGGPELYASLAAACVDGVLSCLVADLPTSDKFSIVDLLQKGKVDISYGRQIDDVMRVWILDAP